MPYRKVYYGKSKPGGPAHWSEKKKHEVCQAYILLGQLRLAASTCNVPEITCKVWKATQWWKDLEQELRRSSKIQLSAKLNEVIQKSLVALNDRVENGDYIYNPKTKDFTRRPISAEHANRITANLIDRSLLLEKSASHEKIDDVGIKARLEKLHEDLIKGFTKPKALTSQVIEGELISNEDSSVASPVSLSDSSDMACDSASNELSAEDFQRLEEQGPRPA